jgi:topoisomerase IA-like protein
MGDENVFLNKSIYNDKYYLKTSKIKDNIPINKDIDVNSLSIDKAKDIIDLYKIYHNKVLGQRDDKDITLKTGSYGLYIIWNKQLFTLPKFILNKLDELDIKVCNYIIDYQLKIKPSPHAANISTEQLKVEEAITANKKSFSEIVKNK